MEVTGQYHAPAFLILEERSSTAYLDTVKLVASLQYNPEYVAWLDTD
jgi:hypothetical protein